MERKFIFRKDYMKIIYVILGFISMGLGIAGSFLPGLPTVPFLLLASFFFARGSERFHGWFTQTRIYKNYLEDFEKNRSMTLKAKIGLLCLSRSTMIAFPIFLLKNNYLRLALILVVIFKYYYFIFRIKTLKPDK